MNKSIDIRKFLLALLMSMTLLHSSVLLAKANPEALTEMEWPLQPGETVRDLAQLIYPKIRICKIFIAETIKLNQETITDCP